MQSVHWTQFQFYPLLTYMPCWHLLHRLHYVKMGPPTLLHLVLEEWADLVVRGEDMHFPVQYKPRQPLGLPLLQSETHSMHLGRAYLYAVLFARHESMTNSLSLRCKLKLDVFARIKMLHLLRSTS